MDASGAADILVSMRNRGVRLWAADGELRYQAPRGALSKDEIERLRGARGQILALLERVSIADVTPPLDRSHRGIAPMAFSQLAHWNLYQLSERPSRCVAPCVLRLRGELDMGALEESLALLMRRHAALRTRIVLADGILRQEISDSAQCSIEHEDLRSLSESAREVELERLIVKHALGAIDVRTGPLFSARLLKVSDDDHVLILVFEHIITDGYSMGILIRELVESYAHALKGQAADLPPVATQFVDFANAQQERHASWLETHDGYWQEHLNGCERLRWPADRLASARHLAGWGRVTTTVDADLKAQLREWCRARRTTLVMSVFTAYIGFLLRWCDTREAVVLYQTDGRFSPDIDNTVGYFAFPLYLRMQLRESDRFADLMERVTEEYCRAHEHADFSYMESQVPRAGFTRNSVFNWGPPRPEGARTPSGDGHSGLFWKRVPMEPRILHGLEKDTEPTIALSETDREIRITVNFPLDRFSFESMERFAGCLLTFIRVLATDPDRRVSRIPLER